MSLDHEPTLATFTDAVRRRAQERPERRAFTFLEDGEVEGACLSFADVDRQARAIAVALADAGLAGQRALLLYPPGIEFVLGFLGCLYAGVVAVPAYPPRSDRSLPRLRAIGRDARPAAVLTVSALARKLAGLSSQMPELAGQHLIATDAVAIEEASRWQRPDLRGESIAFLQYTSGSTSTPKGVEVTHANLLVNEAMIRHAFEMSEESVVVGWLPLFHDMGLIGNVLQPLFAGASCVLMSPMAFLQRPVRWLNAISRYRGTTSGGPNFAYDLCVRKIGPELRSGLDLSSWRLAFNGSEPVRAETLARFTEAFSPRGFRAESFYPCYGLAEATLFVSGPRRGREPVVRALAAAELERDRAVDAAPSEPARRLVGCGRAWDDARVVVVDPASGRRLPDGSVGEIWVAGASVARGYWNRIEESERTFGARLEGDAQTSFLRTGDLGFLHGEEIYVTGRLKDLIIIRGRNLYPHDIELAVGQSHALLRPGCGAAFAIERETEEQLVVAHEIEREAVGSEEEIVEAIRRAVTEEHEIRVDAVILLEPGQLPKTSSGKIQRQACRQAFLAGGFGRVFLAAGEEAPAAPAAAPVAAPSRAELALLDVPERAAWLEPYLAQRAAALIGMPLEDLRLDGALTSFGIDSLSAAELASEIEARLGVGPALSTLLSGGSVRSVALDIAAALSAAPIAAPRLEAGPKASSFPLSIGQRALWFAHELDPGSSAYLLSGAAEIDGELDADRLERALAALVARHPVLASRIELIEGELRTVLPLGAKAELLLFDASDWTERELDARMGEQAVHPFDLTTGPLLRVAVFERRGRRSRLVLAMHHLVSDLGSVDVLLADLGAYYEDPQRNLPPLAVQYADFVRWQNEVLGGPRGEELWRFWSSRLTGDLVSLDLPTDRPRAAVASQRGALVLRSLGGRQAVAVEALARREETTPYVILLAAFFVLLSRLTNQKRLLVGSPTRNRRHAALSGLVGYLANPIVLRADLANDPTFRELIAEVRSEAISAFDHQDFPFPKLVERLLPAGVDAQSPIFQAMFILQRETPGSPAEIAALAVGRSDVRFELGPVALRSLAVPRIGSQFDLTLTMAFYDGELHARFEYSSALFDEPTIERWADAFSHLLEVAVVDPSRRLSSLPTYSAEGRRALLAFGDESSAASAPSTIPKLFAEQLARTPDATALIAAERRLTYRELDAESSRFAEALEAAGAGPEVRVGVCLERRWELLAALLGVLKTGAAYVPLDPHYPRARREHMLSDSGARVLVTSPELVQDMSDFEGRVVFPRDLPELEPRHEARPVAVIDPEHLSHVIYTSGSTGRPKGVAISHRSTTIFLEWCRRHFSDAETARVLATTSMCFDISIFELFGPLVRGGAVVMTSDALDLERMGEEAAATLINTVPSAMAERLRARPLPSSVVTVNLAGEPLPGRLVDEIYRHPGVERVWNLYGPTEDTTYSTGGITPRGATRPPTIGRPIAGTAGYVLDARFEPQLIGVPGRLYLAGVGLARGYLGRPTLTAERFLPDPFAQDRVVKAGGARMYDTGDLVRWLPDGDLEYLGRIDSQVKVRGFRIELGEIEACLTAHPSVAEAAVVVRRDAAGDPVLVAFLLPEAAADRSQLVAEVFRVHLQQSLPAHMIPAAFVPLETFPRTGSGKLDRRALPEAVSESLSLGTEYVAPSTEVESMLAELFAEVLGAERVGVYDSFFALGGHSLRAAQLLARIEATFGVRLSLRTFMEGPTIAGVSLAIAEELLGQVDPSEAAAAVSEL